jgi:LAO/AO transport system kinase
MPSTGDYVQTMKAGIMEIADIFAVNKADLPGAELARMEIEKVLDMAREDSNWRPPVVETCATAGEGLKELWQAVDRHREFLACEDRLSKRRKEQLQGEIADLVLNRLKEEFWSNLYDEPENLELVAKVFSRKIDLYAARDIIVERIREQMQSSS